MEGSSRIVMWSIISIFYGVRRTPQGKRTSGRDLKLYRPNTKQGSYPLKRDFSLRIHFFIADESSLAAQLKLFSLSCVRSLASVSYGLYVKWGELLWLNSLLYWELGCSVLSHFFLRCNVYILYTPLYPTTHYSLDLQVKQSLLQYKK